MRIRKNVFDIGKKAALWLLISVMILGVLAACEPNVPLDDFTSEESTSAEPAPTEPTDTKPEETEPQETEPADTEPVEPEKHILSAVAANEATCTADGSIAYWTCSHCDKIFGDAEGTTEITKAGTVIAAPGHTEVVDEAVAPTYENTGLTEGKHCSVCHAVLQEQKEVPILKPTYHAIVYKNLMGAEAPEPTTYAEHLGLIDLPEVSVEGYTFKGWYTKSEGGEVVDYIPKGSTDDVVLIARWEKISYSIHYVQAAVHDNPVSYTIEDMVYLNDPYWSGLVFVNWTDQDGNVVTKIPKGTTGDLVLTANWTTERNRVITKDNSKLLSTYDEEWGRYYFICELGQISNVIVDSIAETYKKTTSADHTMSISQTVTVEKGVSESIAEMAAQAVTNSEEFTSIIEGSMSATADWNYKVTAEAEVEAGVSKIAAVKAKIGTETSYGLSATVMASTSDSTTKVNSSTNSSSLETTSAISYMEQMSTTSDTSIVIPGTMPDGTYAWVHAVDIRVFAIVTYDINEDCFYLETYSIVDDMHTMLMYNATEYGVGSYSEPMDYNVPCDQVNDYLDSLYFVRYDSNTEDSEICLSVLERGKDEVLPANSFTREGFTFAGWSTSPDGDVMYADEAVVRDLAEGRECVTLYAVWEPIPYTLTWNDGTGYTVRVERVSSYKKGASLNVLNKEDVIYYGDVLAITYTANSGYTIENSGAATIIVTESVDSSAIYADASRDKYTVVFDGNGGSGDMVSVICMVNDTYDLPANTYTRLGWTFAGWSTDPTGEVLYADMAGVQNLATSGETVILYAIWDLVTSATVTVSFENARAVKAGDSFTHSLDLSTVLDVNALYEQRYQISVQVDYVIERMILLPQRIRCGIVGQQTMGDTLIKIPAGVSDTDEIAAQEISAYGFGGANWGGQKNITFWIYNYSEDLKGPFDAVMLLNSIYIQEYTITITCSQ